MWVKRWWVKVMELASLSETWVYFCHFTQCRILEIITVVRTLFFSFVLFFILKITTFRNVIPCNLVHMYWHIRGTSCLPHQGRCSLFYLPRRWTIFWKQCRIVTSSHSANTVAWFVNLDDGCFHLISSGCWYKCYTLFLFFWCTGCKIQYTYTDW